MEIFAILTGLAVMAYALRSPAQKPRRRALMRQRRCFL